MRSADSFDWTAERCDELTALWAAGWSASQIASDFSPAGGLTRSAIIGKVHRMGLPSRRTSKRSERVPPNTYSPPGTYGPKRDPAASNIDRAISNRLRVSIPDAPMPVSERLEAFNATIPESQRKTLPELTSATCKWPVGEPDEPGFFFCGAVPMIGHPYCGDHCRFAYHAGASPKPYAWFGHNPR